jgi:hypothetical protein
MKVLVYILIKNILMEDKKSILTDYISKKKYVNP